MLQINSGKLYPQGVGRTNQLRGVLYTNLVLMGRDNPIVTRAGTLLAAGSLDTPLTIVYELLEQLEPSPIAPGVLVSHTVVPYLHDFAAVTAFSLRVTCTPDTELTERLLNGRRSVGVFTPPNKLIRRIFDRQVWCNNSDAERIVSFVDDLIGLKRTHFLAAMRAIRSYVTGLHRVADDTALSYALLVASIESLAQDFDGHEGAWSDVEEGKRRAIDEALVGVDEKISNNVRGAIVKHEHLALSHRFRAFALGHLPSDYLLESKDRHRVLGKADLRDALTEAYRLRSRYLHSIRTLPDMLTADLNFCESIRIDGAMYLTLQGLERLAHAVISEFVRRGPKLGKETHNYSLERYGIISAPLAPEYWIGRPEGLTAKTAKRWLEAFVEQYSSALQKQGALTDLTDVLPRIEELLPKVKAAQRRPLLALYFMYNATVPAAKKSKHVEIIWERYKDELADRSAESLIFHQFYGTPPNWPLTDQRAELTAYFDRRNRPRGLRLTPLFELGLLLDLAEQFRIAGKPEEARELLIFAVDNFPSTEKLRELEQDFSEDRPVDRSWLLPAELRNQNNQASEDE